MPCLLEHPDVPSVTEELEVDPAAEQSTVCIVHLCSNTNRLRVSCFVIAIVTCA